MVVEGFLSVSLKLEQPTFAGGQSGLLSIKGMVSEYDTKICHFSPAITGNKVLYYQKYYIVVIPDQIMTYYS